MERKKQIIITEEGNGELSISITKGIKHKSMLYGAVDILSCLVDDMPNVDFDTVLSDVKTIYEYKYKKGDGNNE